MKYISAEKLKAEIKTLKGRKGFLPFENMEITDAYMARGIQLACDDIVSLIDSLQSEQSDIIEHICLCAGIPAPFMDGNQWCILKGDNIQVGVVGFGDTKEDALINFIKDIPIQQEQSDVDFEKKLKNEKIKLLDVFGPMNGEQSLAIRNFARHFWNNRFYARKEE